MSRRISQVGHGPQNVSMLGLLALLIGGGLLLAYWRFSAYTERLGQIERLACFAAAALLFLWGLQQSVSVRQKVGRRSGARAALSNGSGARRGVWSISWIGILYLLAGIELLLNIRLWLPEGWPTVGAVVLGLLCIVQGIRRIARNLMPRGLRRRSTKAFTKPGIVYLLVMTVLLIGSLVGHSNMLMLVFAMMVGPFLVNGSIEYSMLRRTDVTRRLPRTAFAGVPFSVDIRLENRKFGLASSVMLTTDRIENHSEELESRVLFARVPARSAKVESYRIRLMQRGAYCFGPLHLTTRFPLGFVERGLIFGRYDELLVYPRIDRLSERWRRGRPQSAEMVDRRMSLRGALHDEFRGMRDYRPGDSPRSIHWRTSVRRNELTVREHEQHRSQDLKLLLDLWEPETPSADDRERQELAISFGATLALDHVRHTRDARLEVEVAGREFSHWSGRSGPSGVDSLLEMLAGVEAGSAPDLTRLATQSEVRRSSSTRVLLLTTRSSESELLDAIRSQTASNGAAPPAGGAEIVIAGAEELAPYFCLDGEAAAVADEPLPPTGGSRIDRRAFSGAVVEPSTETENAGD